MTASLTASGVRAVLGHAIGETLDKSVRQAKFLGAVDYKTASKVERAIEIEGAVRRAKLLGEKITLVAPIRDPVDRAISMMFHHLADGDLDARGAAEGRQAVGEAMAATLQRRLPNF